MRRKMEIKQGYSYHIKDEFFDMIQDKYLMSNKEGEKYRPHFLAIQDSKNKKLYWMIPISSQVEKYKLIIEKKKQKYGKCNTIIIGKFVGITDNIIELMKEHYRGCGSAFFCLICWIFTSKKRSPLILFGCADKIKRAIKSFMRRAV